MSNKDLKKIIGYRPTWAEVNLENLAHNFREIQKLVGPNVKVMATVKADAYGHGLIPVSKKLLACGTDSFGVASIDEGIKLRKEKIRLPILVLGACLCEDISPLFKYDLVPTVCTYDFAQALDAAARKYRRPMNIHVKVDTGMARIGVSHEDAFELVTRIARFRHLRIEGLFTHFAFADMNPEFTRYQIELFRQLVSKLEKSGVSIPLTHAANSMGIVGYKDGHFTMVRPGLILYGLYPSKDIAMHLKPVLCLKTRIVHVKRVLKGQGVSYGHTYITKKNTSIATLPIGYGDGYPRNLSNVASVLIRGKRFSISGRICMDQIMVDVGSFSVKTGDEVILIGSQGKASIGAEELAEQSGTIPYEIVCGLGSRVPRVYL